MQTISYTYDGGNRTLKVTRPDTTLWQRDRNVWTFETHSTSDTIYQLDVTVTFGGNTVASLTFTDIDLSWFKLDLSRVLEEITPDHLGTTGYVDFDIDILYNGTNDYVTTSSGSDELFSILDGRTIAGRMHPCERTIRWHETGEKVDYAKYDSVGGYFYLSQLDMTGANDISYESESYNGGDIDQFVRDATSSYSVKLKKCCVPSRAVWVRFTNTDGCSRYMACKPMSVADKMDGVNYRNDGIERYQSGRYVTSLQRTITLGVTDVEYAEFLTDIRYADDVEYAYSYSGDWQPCALDSFTYKEDGGTHDATLKIIVNI